MKLRTGFVSNSSSSSFIVNKLVLAPWQIEAIKDHINFSHENLFNFYGDDDDSWRIEERKLELLLSCDMDNFDMRQFLVAIGVPDSAIR